LKKNRPDSRHLCASVGLGVSLRHGDFGIRKAHVPERLLQITAGLLGDGLEQSRCSAVILPSAVIRSIFCATIVAPPATQVIFSTFPAVPAPRSSVNQARPEAIAMPKTKTAGTEMAMVSFCFWGLIAADRRRVAQVASNEDSPAPFRLCASELTLPHQRRLRHGRRGLPFRSARRRNPSAHFTIK